MLRDDIRLATLPGRSALYIAWTTNEYSTPRQVTQYWPTTESAADTIRFLAEAGKTLADVELHRGHPGEYSFRTGGAWSSWVRCNLTNGGRTLPDHTEVIDLPAPKVRKGIEVRYRNGRWQKCLRTGWQTV